MGIRPSKKLVSRFGQRVVVSITPEVLQALLSESKRINRSIEHTAAEVLATWYELDYLPAQKQDEKKAP